ncbi:MAG: FtsW/RodA/SpoVE family cell cycle protein [Phototrophicaceae bacterium]
MNNDRSFLERFDWILFGTSLLLVVFGVMVIASATQDAVDPTLVNRVPDQIRFAIFGIIALFFMAFLDYRLLASISNWLYILMIVLLLAVVFFGTEGDGGARRWVNLGILIQPSEVCKILFIVTLSQFFVKRYKEMDKIQTVFKSLAHLGVIAGLIFIQPDFSTTIVFVVIWAVITWAAGLRIKHIVSLILIGLVALPIVLTQLQAYQVERITNFIFPAEEDDLEAQFGSFYNIEQALISIGSGGLTGKGYTSGSQNEGRFLRVRHTDFIFSVIAHEFGFIGGVSTMVLLGVVIFRILDGATYASDELGAMICYGVAGMIFFQTVVSIGMNLNLLPVTGLTLPFVSSGGTSLLFTMIGVGLAESVIVRQRPKKL